MYSLPLNTYTYQLGYNPNQSIWDEVKAAIHEAKESFSSFIWYAFKADLR